MDIPLPDLSAGPTTREMQKQSPSLQSSRSHGKDKALLIKNAIILMPAGKKGHTLADS